MKNCPVAVFTSRILDSNKKCNTWQLNLWLTLILITLGLFPSMAFSQSQSEWDNDTSDGIFKIELKNESDEPIWIEHGAQWCTVDKYGTGLGNWFNPGEYRHRIYELYKADPLLGACINEEDADFWFDVYTLPANQVEQYALDRSKAEKGEHIAAVNFRYHNDRAGTFENLNHAEWSADGSQYIVTAANGNFLSTVDWNSHGTQGTSDYYYSADFSISRAPGLHEVRISKSNLPIPGGGGATATCLSQSHTGTVANNGYANLVWQGDGNLVLYGSAGYPLWDTGTQGRGANLCFQGDGNLAIYNSAWGNPEWMTDTANGEDVLLVLQTDCNLVLYQNGSAYWASNTNYCD